MKKIIFIICLLILFLLISFNACYANSYPTYYYAEAIKVNNNNIEIISNEITIDTIESKVNNTVLLKNTTNEEISTSIILPLENRDLSISINNLNITLNGININYIKNDNGEYSIKTKIPANSGKKLEISYNTDNNLQNAKVIKYNLENFEKGIVGKVKVNIVIDEKNIPLIEKIYPGHYTFENNTISVEYYNYKVSTITKEVIVQKETFSNLLYGRETELNDEEKTFIKEWKEKGINTSLSKTSEINKICKNIIDFININNGKTITYYNEPLNPILYDMAINNMNNEDADLKGRTVCIDYMETEDNKDLYVYKTTGYDTVTVQDEGNYEIERPIQEYVLMPEKEILKTNVEKLYYRGKRGAKIIYVGEGINGEDLKATEEEIIEYVNSINADMYIRIEIYDDAVPNEEIGNGRVGYYNNNNYEIAKAFALCENNTIKSEEDYNRYKSEYSKFYSNYKEYASKYYNDYYKNTVKFLSNDYVANNSEIPTVVQFIGSRVNKDGKYVIEFFQFSGFYNSKDRGLITTNAALKTSQAQKLLTDNKEKNASIKSDIENKISNLQILNNEEAIQTEIQNEIEKNNEQTDNIEINNKSLKLYKKDVYVFCIIGIAILICVIILIIEHRKRKKEGGKNGK